MDTFTWQVVATFAAASGAVAVGWRQVGIAKSQAFTAAAALKVAEAQAATAAASVKVAEGQAATARLVQRTTLFEKRFAVYQAVQAYISLKLAESGTRMRQGDDEFQEDTRKIVVARHQARFLFSDNTHKMITEACDLADAFSMIRGEQLLFPTPESDQKQKEAVRDARLNLVRILTTLHERMGEEMNLRFA